MDEKYGRGHGRDRDNANGKPQTESRGARAGAVAQLNLIAGCESASFVFSSRLFLSGSAVGEPGCFGRLIGSSCSIQGDRLQSLREDGPDPAIAATLNGLNEYGVLRRVSERVAQAHDGAADSLLEIHKNVGRPQRLPEFFARDYHSGMREKERKGAERQILKADFYAVAPELASTQVSLKHSEANHTCG